MTTYNIFDSKPVFVPTWSLDIKIEPGIMINNVWTPTTEADFSSWKINAYYDSTLLLDQMNCVSYNFVDDNKTHSHTLTFNLDFDNTTEGQMFRLFINVEDINVVPILTSQASSYKTKDGEYKFGTEFMGEPGTQTFEIKTPIYRWLLEHEKLVTAH